VLSSGTWQRRFSPATGDQTMLNFAEEIVATNGPDALIAIMALTVAILALRLALQKR
jgi:hypothetical protein